MTLCVRKQILFPGYKKLTHLLREIDEFKNSSLDVLAYAPD